MKKDLKVQDEFKNRAPKEINLALIVVSTSKFEELKSNKKISDNTILLVTELLKNESSISLNFSEIIPDSEEYLNRILTKVMKDKVIDAIIFSGGTDLSLKESTYENLEPRLEKKFSGFGEIFRNLSYNEIGSSAMLSRAAAGILRSKKKNKAVFLIPGSPAAVKLALNALIIPEIEHIMYIFNKKEWLSWKN